MVPETISHVDASNNSRRLPRAITDNELSFNFEDPAPMGIISFCQAHRKSVYRRRSTHNITLLENNVGDEAFFSRVELGLEFGRGRGAGLNLRMAVPGRIDGKRTRKARKPSTISAISASYMRNAVGQVAGI